MKALSNIIMLIWSSIILLFINIQHLSAQGSVTVTLGAGWFLEGYNVGLRTTFGKFQLGGNYAFKSLTGDAHNAYGLHGFYYFSKKDQTTGKRVWYSRAGITHSRWSIERKTWLDARIGRDFNFSKRIGFQTDIGFMYNLFNKYLDGDGTWYKENPEPFLPTGGITLFFRI